jgi:hypothetical protein
MHTYETTTAADRIVGAKIGNLMESSVGAIKKEKKRKRY